MIHSIYACLILYLPRYNKTENLRAGSPEMFAFTHLLLEGRSKYSPNLKPYQRTHEIIDVVEAFSHISYNYNSLLPVQIKMRPSLFLLRRKKEFSKLFEAAFAKEVENLGENIVEETSKSLNPQPEPTPINDVEKQKEEDPSTQIENIFETEVDTESYDQDFWKIEKNVDIHQYLETSLKKSGLSKQNKRSKQEPLQKEEVLHTEEVEDQLTPNQQYTEEIPHKVKSEDQDVIDDKEVKPLEINVKEKIKALIREEKEEEERLKKKLKPMKGKLDILLAEKKNARLSKALKDKLECIECNDTPIRHVSSSDHTLPEHDKLFDSSDQSLAWDTGKAVTQQYQPYQSEEDHREVIDSMRTHGSYHTRDVEDVKAKDFEIQQPLSQSTPQLMASKTSHISLTGDASELRFRRENGDVSLHQTLAPASSFKHDLHQSLSITSKSASDSSLISTKPVKISSASVNPTLLEETKSASKIPTSTSIKLSSAETKSLSADLTVNRTPSNSVVSPILVHLPNMISSQEDSKTNEINVNNPASIRGASQRSNQEKIVASENQEKPFSSDISSLEALMAPLNSGYPISPVENSIQTSASPPSNPAVDLPPRSISPADGRGAGEVQGNGNNPTDD